MRFLIVALSLGALLSACGSEAGSDSEPDESAPPPRPAASASPAAAGPVAVPGGVMSKEELAAKICFYTPAEISAKLGFSVAAGVADTSKLADYNMATCIYRGSQNTVRFEAIWLGPGQVAATRSSMTQMSGGGKIEALPGDADSAYLHDQQDNGSSLHYLRRNVRIQVQATSGTVPFATMKPKLLSLNRVP